MRIESHPGAPGLSAALVAMTILSTIAGCGGRAALIHYQDLIATHALAVDGRELPAREVFVADETWFAVTLDSGRPAKGAVDLKTEAILTLAGCLECEDGTVGEGEGTLFGSVTASGGRRVEFRTAFDRARGWWKHEVDLRRVADRRVEIELEAELPEGCVLRLREATVRELQAAKRLPTNEPPRQVLLISVDTLRRDAVAALGGSVATPNLDDFATQAEAWTRHYAAASWTKPSHASMLTGYYPDTHRAIQLDQAMDPAVTTLAERFQRAGFTTAALVYDCGWLNPKWGFAKGFDTYRISQWRAGRQNRAAANWLLDHRDQPFFFFLHTFEPHSDFRMLPYEAPGLNRITIKERFGVANFGCRQGQCASQLVNALYRHEVPREPLDAEILRSSYDAGVRYLDASLGDLFDALRSSVMWDRMLIVVTSDHGEAFGEHDGFGHNTLYEEILRVPLLVKWPQGERAGGTNDAVSSSIDLAPTLLAAAGIDAAGLPGYDLHRRPSDAPVFSGTLARAVIRGDFKGIFGGAGPPRVFDLTTDPGEERNIVELDRERARVLRELLADNQRAALQLFESFASQEKSGDVALSDSERKRLEAFGYLQ